jgi:hypothetical protein
MWGVGVQLHSFLNWGLGGSVVSLKPRLLYPRGRASATHFKGGSVNHRAVLDVLKKA